MGVFHLFSGLIFGEASLSLRRTRVEVASGKKRRSAGHEKCSLDQAQISKTNFQMVIDQVVNRTAREPGISKQHAHK